jgi:4-aminobutyrate aminotransferase
VKQDLAQRASTVVTPTLLKFTPAQILGGQGVYLHGVDGTRYLDFTSGIAVVNTGHCHPRIVQAAHRQIQQLIHACIHTSWYPTYVQLAEKLADIAPALGMVYLCNSGTEAVEAALKLARYVTQRPAIVAFQGAFHGRTMGALSVTGKAALRRRYEPLLPAVYHVPYPACFRCSYGHKPDTCHFECFDALERLFLTEVSPQDTAAILIEPILGEGGYHVAPNEFLYRLRELCDRHGILLMLDEVQSGIGRTGKMFAWQHLDVVPDVMMLAKALASGFPLGAVLARPGIMSQWGPGAHGSTFGGNPVACAAAVATLEVLKEEGLLENATKLGAHVRDKLLALKAHLPIIGDVRGRGLMLAIELVKQDGSPAAEMLKPVVQRCLERGLMLTGCGLFSNVLRIVPPLVLTCEQADEGLSILAEVLEAVSIRTVNEEDNDR